jgi:subtilase family serine protease
MKLVPKKVPAKGATPDLRAAAVQPGFAAGLAGGYTPADLAKAYGANATGSAITVAIVDAFSDANALADLNTFDGQYDIDPGGTASDSETASTLQIVNQDGAASPLPADDAGWASEESLDLDAVRGLCHKCHIVLVEASSSSDADLATAVNTAATTMHAKIVSNSYGGPESGGLSVASSYDHPDVAILASTGDHGWYDWDFADQSSLGGSPSNMSSTPASFNTVIAVGGTSLYLNSDASRNSETVWNEDGPFDAQGNAAGIAFGATGGGCSATITPKLWQSKVAGYSALGCSGKRSDGDIAAVADPYTGYDIYDTDGGTGWETFGGTSLASPVVAALWADAGGPGAVRYPSLSLYGHFQANDSSLYDVTTGGNGLCGFGPPAECLSYWGANPNTFGYGPIDCSFGSSGTAILANRYQCNARPGYDGPSGVGTPRGPSAFKPMSPTAVITSPDAVTHGTTASFSGGSSTDPFPGGKITKYVWSWGDGTTNTTSAGATTNHTYANSGPETVNLTITDNYGRTGTVALPITVG